MGAMKYLTYRMEKSEKGLSHERPSFKIHGRPKLHDMAYNTNWEDRKPVIGN